MSQNTEITRLDEIKFLQFKIADNPIFHNPIKYDELIESIKSGKLSLEVSDDDGTKIIDDSSIEEIRKTIPFLLKIIDKPRSFIKSLEEKVPVETAKRINHNAIARLARDSNDWHARTLLSVHPKNVIAEVSEETLDIYENRFICTLADRIGHLLAVARQYYQDQLKAIDDNSAVLAVQEYYHSTSHFQFYNVITKRHSYGNGDLSYRDKVSNELASIKGLEKKIKIIKRSEFYRQLHKKRKVTSPIQKTNILIFEFSYNQAYKLWKYLDQNHQEEKLDLKIDIDDVQVECNYHCYCVLCVCAALWDLGFAECTGNSITFENSVLSIENRQWKFKKNDKIILMQVDNGKIGMSYEYAKGKLDEFFFKTDFVNFEALNRSKVDDLTRNILNELSRFDTMNRNTTSQYALVSINMNRCTEDNNYSSRVYRRFFSIGDNYSDSETAVDLARWGNYRTGIAIISPTNLRNNFLRIERIINYHLIRTLSISVGLTKCPICGDKHLRRSGDTDNYQCYKCCHSIAITYCNNCDMEHKKPIIWIKYLDDGFLSKPDIVRETADMKEYHRITKIETVMGESATTSFALQQEQSNTWKLKTICPYCGVQLGNIKEVKS